jgi:signal transduction histidine kinase
MQKDEMQKEPDQRLAEFTDSIQGQEPEIKEDLGLEQDYSLIEPDVDARAEAAGTRPPVVGKESNAWPELELQRAADRIVLARFGPPGLIIDERMNVLRTRGQISRFMELTPGAVSWDLLRIVHHGIANEVRWAVQRAIRDNLPASETAVIFDEKGEQQIQIEVLPITSALARTRCFLILFQHLEEENTNPIEVAQQHHRSMDEKDQLIAQLRHDLTSTRLHLQSLLEESDARIQELLSAKEDQRNNAERDNEVTAGRLTRELRGLTAHLFTAQEEERRRLARELHDDVSQRLSHLQILLHEIRADHYEKEDLQRIEQMRSEVESLNTDVRQMSRRLHSAILQDLGLSAALKALVHEFGERERMPVTFSSQDLPETWSPGASTAIFRIAQEALRNVSNHAGRTHVKVTLAGLAGQLQLRVMDFGVGFDQDGEAPRGGLGMISMRERARLAGGTLEVISALGQGTRVTATVPLETVNGPAVGDV